MFGPGGGIYWHLESYWSLAGISGFQRKNGNNLDIVAICSPLACLWWRYIYMYVLCLYYTFTSCSIFLVLLDIILRNEDLKLYPFLINYIWTLTVFIHVFSYNLIWSVTSLWAFVPVCLLFVGLSVIISWIGREVTLPCSYRSTCLFINYNFWILKRHLIWFNRNLLCPIWAWKCNRVPLPFHLQW